MEIQRARRALMVLMGGALAIGATVSGPASPAHAVGRGEPVHGVATVDGSPSEWTSADAWGTLATNDPPHRTVGSVGLRYDCATETLYVMVAAAPGEAFQTLDPAEAYVRLGSSGKLVSGLSGDDGQAPDFAWIGAEGTTAAGFEASAPIEPGAYPARLRIHAKLPNDSPDGYETVDLQPRFADLALTCDPADVDPIVIGISDPADPADPPDPAAAGSSSGSLPRTGMDLSTLVPLGGGLLLVGSTLVVRARARRA